MLTFWNIIVQSNESVSCQKVKRKKFRWVTKM